MRGFYVIIGVCALFFGTSVTGVSFTSTPDKFVVGESGTLTLACSVTESDVSQVYNIKIKRAVTPGSTSDELMASFESGTATLDDGITDDKGFSVTGNLNGASSLLELTMDRSKLTCSDARLYKCEVAYDSTTSGNVVTLNVNLTLHAFVLPGMNPPVEVKKNGFVVDAQGSQFNVGDQLELQCRANIGSINSTTIRWRKRSEMQSSEFIGYDPQEGSYEHSAPLSDNQCGYTRTATIRYNITTTIDGYQLAFQCYVAVSGYPSSALTPSGLYTTTFLQYDVDVTSTTTSSSGAASAGTGGGNVGAIVGGVIGGLLAIIIIVVVVWFLWFRRRDGETYTTKEEYGSENPNMAPPVETYATVDKKKRGHENKGLDEPHERRRHHYENGPGRSNYGMDRDPDDYDSRDGSPTMTHQGISHMGMDPMDGRIGTGV